MRQRRMQAQRSQQQRQHLETTNLGEGTVDHGFDAPAGVAGINPGFDPPSPGAMLGGTRARWADPGRWWAVLVTGGSAESSDGMTPQGGVVNGTEGRGGMSPGPSPSRRPDPHGVGDDSVRTE